MSRVTIISEASNNINKFLESWGCKFSIVIHSYIPGPYNIQRIFHTFIVEFISYGRCWPLVKCHQTMPSDQFIKRTIQIIMRMAALKLYLFFSTFINLFLNWTNTLSFYISSISFHGAILAWSRVKNQNSNFDSFVNVEHIEWKREGILKAY